MTDTPSGTDGSPKQAPPTPVTVVGYPGHAPVSSGQSVPGMADVRIAISSLRAWAIVTVILVVLLAAGSIIGIVTLRGQVSQLSQQVADLSAQQSELAARSAPAESSESAGTPEGATGSQATQLPPAAQLPSGLPVPAGLDGAGAILIGNPDATNVVEVYVDYQCPFCQRWEQEIGETLARRALDPGSDLLIKQFNLAFLGETSPTLDPPGSSARAASASLCILEGEGPEAFANFNAQVFAIADPERSSVQFTTPELAQLAVDAGASPETVACIETERHVPFVAVSTQSGFARGVQGTPTVIVNGRTLDDSFGDAELLSLVEQF